MKNRPVFSVVTSTLNSEAYIERCVRSVLSQSCKDIEHIIVDGVSKDSTLEKLNQIQDPRLVVNSAPDSGIYDAWNTALGLCRGDWIVFLGSDDFFVDGDALETIRRKIVLPPSEKGFVSTRLRVGSADGLVTDRVTPFGWRPISEILRSPVLNMPPHGSMFHSRAIFEEGFRFDSSYHGSADKKLFFEVFHEANIQYVDVLLTHFSLGGVTNSSGNKLERWREKKRLRLDLNLPFFPSAYIRSWFSSIIRDASHKLGRFF